MKKLLQILSIACLLFVTIISNESNAQYTYEREWGSKSLGLLQFQYAKDVASNSLGEIYVNDGDKIYKFSPDGELLTQWTSPNGWISTINIDSNDDLIVGGQNYFFKLDVDFDLKFIVNNPGTEDGQIESISDISVDNANNIYILINGWDYVINQTLFRIQVYSPEGIFLSKILSQHLGDWSSTENSVVLLEKIATSDDRLIIPWRTITNSVTEIKIRIYTKSGEYISEFGSVGSEAGQYSYVHGLSTDLIGNIYVSDNEKILKFTETGAFSSSPAFTHAYNFVVEPDGNYITTDYRMVSRIDASGQILTFIDGKGDGEGQFESPTDVAIDSKNNMYVMDYGNARIQKFDENGNFVLQFGGRGDLPNQFVNSVNIQVSPLDEVVILDLNGKVIKYDSLGNFILSFGKWGTNDGEFAGARDFDLDSEGNIYVLESNTNQSARVQKFSSNGEFITKWGELGLELGQFADPDRIVIDHENNIHILDRNQQFGNLLLKFDSEGQYISQIAGVGYANDLEADKYGNIYSFNGYQIIRLNTFGYPQFTVHSVQNYGTGFWISPDTDEIYYTDNTDQGVIKVGCVLPTPQFSVNPAPSRSPTSFIDESTNVISGATYFYDFGDGNTWYGYGAVGNTDYTYDSSGIFTVSLSISQGCMAKSEQSVTIVDLLQTPSIPASDILFSYPLATTMNLQFTPGDGANHLVVMSVGGAPSFIPEDGQLYSGEIGNNQFVVYSGDSTFIPLNNLNPDTEYFFTVFEFNKSSDNVKYLVENAPVASQKTLVQPNVFVVTPANGAIGRPAILNITANAVNGASIYTIQVSESPDFYNIVSEKSGSRTQNFTLQYGKQYYVRVKTNLSPAFGKTTSFTTLIPSVVVTSPKNGALNLKTTLTITASALAGATQYTIELNEMADFTGEGFIQIGSRTQVFAGLKYGQVYYSRVLTDIYPVYASSTTFTTAIPPVYAINPANGAVNRTVALNIEANEIMGASSYTIELNEASDFSSIGFVQTGPRIQSFSGLSYNTQYFVRVKTEFSPVYGKVTSFNTADASYFAYVTNPPNGATEKNVNLNIASREVIGASFYTIQLSESPDFSTIDFESSGSTRQLPFSGLKYNTTYYNRVITDLGSTYGKVHSFTTSSVESLTYVTSPANNAQNVNTNVSITANLVSEATQYTIQLSKSPDFSIVEHSYTGPSRSFKVFNLQSGVKYYNRVLTDRSPNYGLIGCFTTIGTYSGARIASVDDRSTLQSDIVDFTVETYPNPFNSSFEILVSTFDSQSLEVNLTDLNGRVLFSKSNWMTNQQYEISPDIKQGMYLLILKTGSQTKTFKIVRE